MLSRVNARSIKMAKDWYGWRVWIEPLPKDNHCPKLVQSEAVGSNSIAALHDGLPLQNVQSLIETRGSNRGVFGCLSMWSLRMSDGPCVIAQERLHTCQQLNCLSGSHLYPRNPWVSPRMRAGGTAQFLPMARFFSCAGSCAMMVHWGRDHNSVSSRDA